MTQAAAVPAAAGPAAAVPAAAEVTAELDAALARERELRRELAAEKALAQHERERSRRTSKTAHERGKQAERRSGKAAARKRRAGRQQAAGRAELKESERVRKRKQPVGEPLHTGERKHRRLIGGGGSGSYRSPTPPATTSRPRSVPHGVDPSPRLTFGARTIGSR